jgi:hypothetical protein
MSRTPDEFEELQRLCADARIMTESSIEYVLLPNLKLPPGVSPAVVDGLLCPQTLHGYETRLFLSHVVPGKGNNWRAHRILDREWHSPSWKGITADDRLIEILIGHLEVYQ